MRTTKKSRFMAYSLAACLSQGMALMDGGDALAATNTFTGNNGTDFWNVTGNWSLNAVPVASDDVIINLLSGTQTPASVQKVGSTPAVNSLAITDGALLSSSGNLDVTNGTNIGNSTGATSTLDHVSGDYNTDSMNLLASGKLILDKTVTFNSTSAWTSLGLIDTHSEATIDGGTLTLAGSSIFSVLNRRGSSLPPGPGPSDVTIAADLVVNDTAKVDVTQSHILTLKGETTFNSGTLNVASGELIIDGIATFDAASTVDLGTTGDVEFTVGSSGNVTINQSTFDWTDTNQTVASGGSLTINTDNLGNGLERTSTLGGTLNVNTLNSGQLEVWKLSTRLEFEEGTALARTSPSINGVDLEVVGGSSGELKVNSYSDAEINVPINFRGGSSGSDFQTVLNIVDKGTMTISDEVIYNRFSSTVIQDTGVLTLSGNTAVRDRVRFNGTGTLIVSENYSLDVSGRGVLLGVNVVNNGELSITLYNSTTRDLTIGDTGVGNDRSYTQADTGTLNIVIEGSDASEDNYDDIDIYGDVVLAGTLDIDLDSFTPSASISSGDVYEVMTWTGTLTGVFDTVLGQLQDSAVMLGLVYNSGSLDIVTRIPGDMTGDGFVGIDDLTTINGSNWNTNVTAGDLSLGDANGDGYVGINDLTVVLGNWGASAPPVSASVIPEPASLVLLNLGGLAVMRRTRG